jgi:hypothetical protein
MSVAEADQVPAKPGVPLAPAATGVSAMEEVSASDTPAGPAPSVDTVLAARSQPVAGRLPEPDAPVGADASDAPAPMPAIAGAGRFALTLHAVTEAGPALETIAALGFVAPARRTSAFAPETTLVAYFDPDSRAAAELLAEALDGSVEDLTGLLPKSPAGTLDIYLAR